MMDCGVHDGCWFRLARFFGGYVVPGLVDLWCGLRTTISSCGVGLLVPRKIRRGTKPCERASGRKASFAWIMCTHLRVRH